MKKAVIIKVEEYIQYKNENGCILDSLSNNEKTYYNLYQPHLVEYIRNEKIVSEIKAITKKQINLLFQNYLKENNISNIYDYSIKYI